MKILNHVSVKIALIMVFIVLPLNVIAIVFTENAQQTIVDQESFNTQKLADYQMQQLENVMDNARALLTIFQRQDADLLIIKNENVNGYEYESSKLKFFYRLKNMAETTDGADGYFYYFPDRRDGACPPLSNKNFRTGNFPLTQPRKDSRIGLEKFQERETGRTYDTRF